MKLKPFLKSYISIVALLLITQYAGSQDKNWTHFRGSNLDGIAIVKDIPLRWDSLNTKWKTAIHGKGHSSPVVFNNQIWLTSGSADGKDLYAVCADYETGKILHDIKVIVPEETIGKHSINTYASPSPCIEKGFVYVHYGSLGTACIKTSDGSIVWTRTDLKCKHVQGPGSSPILYKNLLILHYEGTDVRFIVALDKATGKQVWRTDRPEEPYVPLPNIGTESLYHTSHYESERPRSVDFKWICCLFRIRSSYRRRGLESCQGSGIHSSDANC